MLYSVDIKQNEANLGYARAGHRSKIVIKKLARVNPFTKRLKGLPGPRADLTQRTREDQEFLFIIREDITRQLTKRAERSKATEVRHDGADSLDISLDG